MLQGIPEGTKSMKVTETGIAGLKLVHLDVHGDSRGFFVERFHAEKFREMGLPTDFAQDNHSRSAPGVLRGLHYQFDPPQGKLVGCVQGRIWDVAVDIRKDSPTFGKHFGVELTDVNGLLLWIPEGFAHGFCVLGNEPAGLLYKVTNPYNPKGEGGIRWDDPDLNIAWPVKNPIVSARDTKLANFSDYKNNPTNKSINHENPTN
jgi:dTDP-4-dehydrorhamnose 3,5-epimerase